jgi:L-asparaginase / beta-aspartyl-peptidase
MKTALVVHAGAGAWEPGSERLAEAEAACARAAAAGQAVLVSGGTALDAVEAAVRVLEDCPVLDAGRGSYPNAAGRIEMDALIMDGRTLDLGAVAAVERVRNPVSLARRVMDACEHSFLVGPGAGDFADAVGFPRCELSDLLVGEAREGGRDARRGPGPPAGPGSGGSTVGAVARDVHGNLAAATSTGGTRAKLPGRVGDSPLVGSGAYADNWTAAVSATGHGEALMKIVMSKRVCDFVAGGLSAQGACRAAIQVLAERVGGAGGVIAVDARGRPGVAYNTSAMPHAVALGADPPTVGR